MRSVDLLDRKHCQSFSWRTWSLLRRSALRLPRQAEMLLLTYLGLRTLSAYASLSRFMVPGLGMIALGGCRVKTCRPELVLPAQLMVTVHNNESDRTCSGLVMIGTTARFKITCMVKPSSSCSCTVLCTVSRSFSCT